MLTAFKVRVDDRNDEYQDEVKRFIARFDTHLVVQEQEPKIHYHMFIMTDITHPAIGARLKKAMPNLSGNKDFSIGSKHHDWEGYIGYCLKMPNTKIISVQGLEHPLDYYKDYYDDAVAKAEAVRTARKNQDRHNPVWETIANHLTKEMFSLPDDELFLLALKEWGEGAIEVPPPQFSKYVESATQMTMIFLQDTGRELHNSKIQGYVENYLNLRVPYYRTRTVKRLAKRILL